MLYKHYKGAVYRKLYEARHTETEEWLVVYCDVRTPEKIWCRPKVMFEDMVTVDGVAQRRFMPVDEITE